MKDTLRMKLRFQNNRLYELIFGVYKNTNQFCDVIGIHPTPVSELLNLKKGRTRTKYGGYRKEVLTICKHFGESPEFLFPDSLYQLEQTRFVATTNGEAGLFIEEQVMAIEEVENQIECQELREELEKSFRYADLSQRDMDVLRKRAGIDGKEYTLEEIAEEYGITRERVRQIEKRSNWKISHCGAAQQHLEQFREGALA